MISLFRCELICKRGRLSFTPVVNASSRADCPRHMKDKIRISSDGYVHAPTKPGLGYEIDRGMLEKMTRKIES